MEFKDLYQYCDDMIASRIASGARSAVTVKEIKAEMVHRVDWLDGINFHPYRKKDNSN